MIQVMQQFLGLEPALFYRFLPILQFRYDKMDLLRRAQVAVSDLTKNASIVEGVALVAELIYHYAVVENLYPLSASEASLEMERALVTLYAAILIYLSKARSYFDQGSMSQ